MRANPPRTPFTRRDERRFYLFILPWLLGLLLFQAGPILAALALSLSDWNLVAAPEWRGLTHYDELIHDSLFHIALKNTLYYSLASVPLGVGLAFGLALLVNRSWFGMEFFRTVFLLPTLVSGAAIALVWGWLFNPRFGAVNAALQALHPPTPGWLADPGWAMPTVILLSLWSVGGWMLIYLAGLLFIVLLATMMVPVSTTLIPRFVMFARLGWTNSLLPLILPPFFAGPFYVFLFRQFFRSVPREYFDAAEIDGCSPFGLFWKIALPMAKPAIAASAMFSALAAWNDFIDPLVVLSSTDKQTYQIGLSTFQGQYFNQLHLMMPMALLGVIPVLLLVILGQHWIATGIASDVGK